MIVINMAKTRPQYINELSILYETYKGQEVSDAVGVSVRQIQNYLKEDDPPTPSMETMTNIREAYAKHIAGEPILRRNREDFKDKYIESLERENKRLQKDLDLSLGEIRHDLKLTRAMASTNQNLLVEILAKQRGVPPAKVVSDANKLFDEFYKSMKEEGSFAYVGK